MSRPWKSFLTLLVATILSSQIASCRSAQTHSSLESNQHENTNIIAATNGLLDTVTSRYFKHIGLRGVIFLTYSQLIALGKLPAEDMEIVQTRGLVANLAAEEQAFYGAIQSTDGGLLKRSRKLSVDVAEEVQHQNVRRGLQFKIQLIRAILATENPSTLPSRGQNIAEEINALQQAVDAMPMQP